LGNIWLHHLNKPDRARPYFERALSICDSAADPDALDVSVTDALQNLGDVLAALDQHDEALPIYQRLLALREAESESKPTEQVADASYRIAQTMLNVSTTQPQLAAAKALLNRVVAIRVAVAAESTESSDDEHDSDDDDGSSVLEALEKLSEVVQAMGEQLPAHDLQLLVKYREQAGGAGK